MDRLTDRKDGKAKNCNCFDWCATCTGAECLEVKKMLNRLAAYKDTGLTPEEIKEDTPNIQKIEQELASYREAEERGELVRVVRCRDCKYHDPEDMKCDCGGLARIGCNFALDANYFCAYGEPCEETEAALKEYNNEN